MITAIVAVILASAAGCTRKPAPTASAGDESDLVRRGRSVYMSNCTACHGTDPRQAGTLGPDVHGSSVALLEAKLLRGEYPEGHERKRKSQAMPKLPHLKDEIPALHAFLTLP